MLFDEQTNRKTGRKTEQQNNYEKVYNITQSLLYEDDIKCKDYNSKR